MCNWYNDTQMITFVCVCVCTCVCVCVCVNEHLGVTAALRSCASRAPRWRSTTVRWAAQPMECSVPLMASSPCVSNQTKFRFND